MQASALLTDCQRGFRSVRSCNRQPLEVMGDLTTVIENNQPLGMILLDFKKVFVSALHLQPTLS